MFAEEIYILCNVLEFHLMRKEICVNLMKIDLFIITLEIISKIRFDKL